MQSVKFLREPAHRDVPAEYVCCQTLMSIGPDGKWERSFHRLEALHITLRAARLQANGPTRWIHPFHHSQDPEDFIKNYWLAPKVFILRAISIPDGENRRYLLRIGEKNYHSWFGPKLKICKKGEEYERGLALYAPQYFNVICPDTEDCFNINFHGIFLREIC